MTVVDMSASTDRVDEPGGARVRYRSSSKVAAGAVVVGGAVLFLLSFATRTPSARIARPGFADGDQVFAGGTLLGFERWHLVGEVGSLLIFVVVLAVMVLRSWEQRKATMGLLFLVAGTSLVWLDPIGNWATYAVFDPRHLHWPDTWAWTSISPTVEPLVNVVGYFGFYIGPPFLAILVLRQLIQPRRPTSSIVHRRPLVSLVVVTYVVGFVLDALMELVVLKFGAYGYTQVISFGSVNKGQPDQFALLLQSSAITIPFSICAVLWWRDDTGTTGAERLAARWPVTRRHGQLGVFGVIFVLMNLGYLAYLLPYVAVRHFDLATVTARPWHWCATQVYDPNGRFEAEGEQGPFFEGIGSGWLSGRRTPEGVVGEPLPDACPS